MDSRAQSVRKPRRIVYYFRNRGKHLMMTRMSRDSSCVGRKRLAAPVVVARATSSSSVVFATAAAASAAPTSASTLISSTASGDGPAFAEACDLDDAASAAERELKENVKPYLDANPSLVVSRVLRITFSAVYVAFAWTSNNPRRGAILRDAVAELGPVFVKLGRE